MAKKVSTPVRKNTDPIYSYSNTDGLDANILYFINKTPEKIIDANASAVVPVPYQEPSSHSQTPPTKLGNQLSFMDHMNPAVKVMATSYIATLINQGVDQKRIDAAIASFKIASKEPVHNL